MSSPSIRKVFIGVLAFVIILWVIHIIQALFHTSFAHFGILPRDYASLPGILFAPLIHGSFSHIAANSMALLVLGTALIYGYPRTSKIVIPFIYLGTGLAVWIFGRESYHIGASSLTFGFMTFVFVAGILHWKAKAIALSCLVFFLYGGMIWGIFPSQEGISFESHLFSAIIGIVCAFAFRNYENAEEEPEYDWEEARQNNDYSDDNDRRWH